MTLYCGIDLHSNNSIVVVTNESDQVVFQSRFPNDLDLIRQALQPFQAELAGVVVASTYNWYWLVDGLMDAGFSLHLANPAAIKQYQGLKHSDDPSDARWLAHLLRLGILPEGYIYPKAERPLRDLLRKRSQLVRQKVTHILSIENLTLRNTGHALTTDALRRWGNAEVDARFPNPELGLAIKANLAVLRWNKSRCSNAP
jgi:transposase